MGTSISSVQPTSGSAGVEGLPQATPQTSGSASAEDTLASAAQMTPPLNQDTQSENGAGGISDANILSSDQAEGNETEDTNQTTSNENTEPTNPTDAVPDYDRMFS